MDLIDSVEFALWVAALAVPLGASFPIIRQAYLDRVSPWLYRCRLRRAPQGPYRALDYRTRFPIQEPYRNEAFFEVRFGGEGVFGRELPFHISVWPSQRKVGPHLPYRSAR